MCNRLKNSCFILIFLLLSGLSSAVAQFGGGVSGMMNNGFGYDTARTTTSSTRDISVDSLRKRLESRKDSIIYTAKFIKYTQEEFLADSTILFPLDTSARNFHLFNPLNKPYSPTMNLGVIGMAYRPMLFEPVKTIGFDMGYHFFDRYMIGPKDIKYYQARARYTELYYVSPLGGKQEEKFHVLHSQNVKPNWNVGGFYGKTGSQGYYAGQVSDILNASLWNWYESENKRYTLLANATFNTVKSYENGSILNDSIFTAPTIVQPLFETTRLYESYSNTNAMHDVRNNTIYIKQFYNIGKQRVVESNAETVLPTQRISYTFAYNRQKYNFRYGREDLTGLLKNNYIYPDSTSDSTQLNHLRNEFTYSFYVRGKRVSFLKNELKINAGIIHDYYRYRQYTYNNNFQNLTLTGNLTYGFNHRANLNLLLRQIFQGPQAGDFLYQAQSEINLSNSVGKVILGAYSQNQSPPLIYERQLTNHHWWNLNFNRVTTQNVSFAYVNPKFYFTAKAEYFLVGNHLYFTTENDDIKPDQLGTNINLMKITVGKDFHFWRFTSENHLVYQKTDFESVLRTPELYTYHSFYYHQDFFKVLKMDIGFDVRYFSQYTANAYAPAIGQFYNKDNTRFGTSPIVDVWMRTNWKRANLFIRYDYVNQGLFSKGYYTVDRYPMPYSLLRFGLSWNFYD